MEVPSPVHAAHLALLHLTAHHMLSYITLQCRYTYIYNCRYKYMRLHIIIDVHHNTLQLHVHRHILSHARLHVPSTLQYIALHHVTLQGMPPHHNDTLQCTTTTLVTLAYNTLQYITVC